MTPPPSRYQKAGYGPGSLYDSVVDCELVQTSIDSISHHSTIIIIIITTRGAVVERRS